MTVSKTARCSSLRNAESAKLERAGSGVFFAAEPDKLICVGSNDMEMLTSRGPIMMVRSRLGGDRYRCRRCNQWSSAEGVGDRQKQAIALGDRYFIRKLNDSLSNRLVNICHCILITKKSAGGLNGRSVNFQNITPGTKRFVKDQTLKTVFVEMRPITRRQRKGTIGTTTGLHKRDTRPATDPPAQRVTASDDEKR